MLNRPGDWPTIKGVVSVAGDALEGLGQVALDQDLPGRKWDAVPRKDRARRRELGQTRIGREALGKLGADREAMRRQLDRRREYLVTR